MSIPYTDAFRVRTVFAKRRIYMGSPKGLFRCGIVARANTFQISNHNHLQYHIIRLIIKQKLYYRLDTDNTKTEILFLVWTQNPFHNRTKEKAVAEGVTTESKMSIQNNKNLLRL